MSSRPRGQGLPHGRSVAGKSTLIAGGRGPLRPIVLLLAHLGGELPSGYLANRFAHSWPTTTRHLHVLEAAGLVTVRREGRSCVYRLERDRLRTALQGWLALLEPPTPDQTWRSAGPTSVTKGTKR